jgi:hypothetical protein
MRGAIALTATGVLALSTPARADMPPMAPIGPPAEDARAGVEIELADGDFPGVSYLWDGGALPFFWGALAGRIAVDQMFEARSSPLFFSEAEGGMSHSSWQIPGWGITAAGGAVALAMVAGDDHARWYHAKGLAESLATGAFVTGAVKLSFGRHRPDYAEDTSDNRSFPSGHATQAFAVATYTVLYLRGHGFDQWRAPPSACSTTVTTSPT